MLIAFGAFEEAIENIVNELDDEIEQEGETKKIELQEEELVEARAGLILMIVFISFGISCICSLLCCCGCFYSYGKLVGSIREQTILLSAIHSQNPGAGMSMQQQPQIARGHVVGYTPGSELN